MPNLIYILFEQPLFNLLTFIYKATQFLSFNPVLNLGFYIVILTLIIKVLMLPFVIPSFKNMKKQKALKPELDKLKAKYDSDKKKLAEEQMKLFKEHGINPTSGCLSQIVMIFALIGLYQVVDKLSKITYLSELNYSLYATFLHFSEVDKLENLFVFFNMSEPDTTFILPVLAAVFTLISSAMLLPELTEAEKAAKKASTNIEDMAYTMQQQMTILAPIMTFFACLTLDSALSLYIVVSAIFGVAQQYFLLGGFGGVDQYVKLVNNKLKEKGYIK
jgi:YidC/Oxa1 family membrane protein insertase